MTDPNNKPTMDEREKPVDVKAITIDTLLHFKDRIEMDQRNYKDVPTKQGMETGALICEVIGYLKAQGRLK